MTRFKLWVSIFILAIVSSPSISQEQTIKCELKVKKPFRVFLPDTITFKETPAGQGFYVEFDQLDRWGLGSVSALITSVTPKQTRLMWLARDIPVEPSDLFSRYNVSKATVDYRAVLFANGRVKLTAWDSKVRSLGVKHVSAIGRCEQAN